MRARSSTRIACGRCTRRCAPPPWTLAGFRMWRADGADRLRRLTAVAWLAAALCAAPATAQRLTPPSWLALDTSADVDRAVDANGVSTGGAIFDAYVAARVVRGLEFVARPWTQRQANGE